MNEFAIIALGVLMFCFVVGGLMSVFVEWNAPPYTRWSREKLVAHLDELYDRDRTSGREFQEMCDWLARLDGCPFDGRYYYLKTREGDPILSGISGAYISGGPKAAAEYERIMGASKKD